MGDDRRERLAAQLRANLGRRKARARALRDVGPDAGGSEPGEGVSAPGGTGAGAVDREDGNGSESRDG